MNDEFKKVFGTEEGFDNFIKQKTVEGISEFEEFIKPKINNVIVLEAYLKIAVYAKVLNTILSQNKDSEMYKKVSEFANSYFDITYVSVITKEKNTNLKDGDEL